MMLRAKSRKGGMTMRAATTLIATLVFSLCLWAAPAGKASAIEVGEKAPDFELESTAGGKLRLSNLKGKNILINFYVLDFSPT